jgi:hypothetical protein
MLEGNDGLDPASYLPFKMVMAGIAAKGRELNP